MYTSGTSTAGLNTNTSSHLDISGILAAYVSASSSNPYSEYQAAASDYDYLTFTLDTPGTLSMTMNQTGSSGSNYLWQTSYFYADGNVYNGTQTIALGAGSHYIYSYQSTAAEAGGDNVNPWLYPPNSDSGFENVYDVSIRSAAVPEPTSFGALLVATVLLRRRRARR
jgi:hypothetical protein